MSIEQDLGRELLLQEVERVLLNASKGGLDGVLRELHRWRRREQQVLFRREGDVDAAVQQQMDTFLLARLEITQGVAVLCQNDRNLFAFEVRRNVNRL